MILSNATKLDPPVDPNGDHILGDPEAELTLLEHGIGLTMSLFIAREAVAVPADFAAAKIAIFTASLIAGVVGTAILWPKSANREPSG